MWLNTHLARHLGEDRMVGVSHPYEVSEHSQPVPDVAIVATSRFQTLTDAVAAAELVPVALRVGVDHQARSSCTPRTRSPVPSASTCPSRSCSPSAEGCGPAQAWAGMG